MAHCYIVDNFPSSSGFLRTVARYIPIDFHFLFPIEEVATLSPLYVYDIAKTLTTECTEHRSNSSMTSKEQQTSSSKGHLDRVTRHLSEDIRPSLFAELQLLLLTFCTGMQGKHQD